LLLLDGFHLDRLDLELVAANDLRAGVLALGASEDWQSEQAGGIGVRRLVRS
jgi:hypothetical protein